MWAFRGLGVASGSCCALRLLFFSFSPSVMVPQLQVPILDRSVSAELQLLHRGHSHHGQMVASSACLSLWTPLFWVLVLAFQTEAPLL